MSLYRLVAGLDRKLDEIIRKQGQLYVRQILLEDQVSELTALVGEVLAAVSPPPAVRIKFIVDGNEVTRMQITDIQSAKISLEADDAKGNVTKLPDGVVPAWSVDDTSMGAVVAAADGMSAEFTPAGKLGSAKVSVSAGDLAGELQVDVVASAAVKLQLAGVAVDAAPSA